VIGFRADLAALADLVSALSAFDRRAADAVADLEAGVSRLHGSWDGPAAAAHAAAHRRWLRAENEVREAACALRRLVDVARANYESAAGANGRMWA
jgi:uncharacterized protein YukE